MVITLTRELNSHKAWPGKSLQTSTWSAGPGRDKFSMAMGSGHFLVGGVKTAALVFNDGDIVPFQSGAAGIRITADTSRRVTVF